MYDEGIIHIKRGKGAKDRIVVLHEEFSDLLKSYQQTLPTNQPFVFAGKYYQLPISARSVQWAFVTKQTPSTYEQPLKRQLLKKMLGTDPDVCPDCGVCQTLRAKPLVATEKYYFRRKTKWHNVHIKLRQDESNLTNCPLNVGNIQRTGYLCTVPMQKH